ncbi:FliG C-terminal domain-containing protein [uncultured Jannaschia sp.]|uniref:FliG C-terminal domain-containing protein n=1 Tax=uncultured Jannaschia sp. TaxID=293347 RepID=UPI00261CF120|nr:FliG C-terminal domain-containing protein [uncultured Jannaschia sp.]
MSDFAFPSLDARPQLTKRQKAAVLVHLLISGGVDSGLRELPPEQQRAIVREMARLRFVDRETLAEVVQEFAAELDSIGLHFPRDLANVVETIGGHLSFEVVESLTAELGPDAPAGEGPWAVIAELDVPALLAFAEGESDEVCAIVMSKLPSGRAAELMAELPSERAEAIAAAFARTEDVAPGAVGRIGMALGRQSASRTAPAFETDSVIRVAGILNVATARVRNAVLESLDASDAAFAARVRKAVFSFENIPERIEPRSMPKILKEVDALVVVKALSGLPDEMREVETFILGTISSRLADQFRDQIAEAGTIPADESEAARSDLVATIRRLEEAGEITFVTMD